jgi:hypothetical protein
MRQNTIDLLRAGLYLENHDQQIEMKFESNVLIPKIEKVSVRYVEERKRSAPSFLHELNNVLTNRLIV